MLDAFEIRRSPRICPTTGREGVFCTERHDGTNLDSRVDKIPNTWTRLRLCRWKMRDMLQHHMYVTLEKDKRTLCDSKVKMHKNENVWLRCVAKHCTGPKRTWCLPRKEVRSRTAKADVLAMLFVKRVARHLVGHREVARNYPYQNNPHELTATRTQIGLDTWQTQIVKNSWSVDAWGSLA